MENIRQSPFLKSTFSSSPSLCNISSSSMLIQQNPFDLSALTPNQLVLLLHESNLREEVMYQLIKKRDICEDIAPLVWNNFNTVHMLLQELIAVYRKLSPSMLSTKESSRACKALALFQVIAKHPETRGKLIDDNPSGDDKPLEYLRLTNLGVLGSLTKVLDFFLKTEVVPLCLKCMDLCDEMSQKVATLIVMKIMMQEKGMTYCCAMADRFYLIVKSLYQVVEKLYEKPCLLHLKYVIQCYLSLSEVLRFARPCDALRSQVPPQLFDNTFKDIICDDHETSWMLRVLHFNIYGSLYFQPIENSNKIEKQDTTNPKAKGKK